MKSTDFSKYITIFLTKHLPDVRNLSIHTIRSYRDAFKFFLHFLKSKGENVNKFTISKLKYDLVSEYLDWLEKTLQNSISTRNQRLAAVKSFVNFLLIEEPSYMFEYQKILSLKAKRYKQTIIQFLSADEIKYILNSVDISDKKGLRDLCLLTILYDTAARVQELCDLKYDDLRLDAPAKLTLTGKGNKERQVPITRNTVVILKKYVDLFYTTDNPKQSLFVNSQNTQLSRAGIAYIVMKYFKKASENHQFSVNTLTPHIFRHSKAMHLCQADIAPIYIKDFLGHAKLETTMTYIHIDIERKRKALEQASPNSYHENLTDWNADTGLLEFLNSI